MACRTTSLGETQLRGNLFAPRIVFAILGPAIIYWLVICITRQEASKFPIRMVKAPLELGDISPYETINAEFSLKNESGKDIEISELRPDCDCMTVTWPGKILASGEQDVVRVSIDVDGSGFTKKIVEGESFSLNLVPHGGRGPIPTNGPWEITGQFKSWGWVSSRTIDFGDRLIHGLPYPSQEFEIITSADVDLSESSFQCNPAIMDVLLQQQPQSESRQKRLTVRLNPHEGLGIGSHSTTLAIHANGKAHGISIPVLLDVLPPVKSTPSSLFLRESGDQLREGVISLASADLPFRVDGYETEPAALLSALEVTSFSPEPGNGEFLVRFAANKEQAQQQGGTLYFRVITSAAGAFRVPVKIVIVR